MRVRKLASWRKDRKLSREGEVSEKASTLLREWECGVSNEGLSNKYRRSKMCSTVRGGRGRSEGRRGV